MSVELHSDMSIRKRSRNQSASSLTWAKREGRHVETTAFGSCGIDGTIATTTRMNAQHALFIVVPFIV